MRNSSPPLYNDILFYQFIISSQADTENSDDNDDENANDNLGHKKLEQWGEKNKMEAVSMDAMGVDNQTDQSVNLSICIGDLFVLLPERK